MKRQAVKRGAIVELMKPEDVRALLMKPDVHWKDGRSAAELTHAWWDGTPSAVVSALASDVSLAQATCERIVFEKKSKVPGAGGATRTDLVACFEADRIRVVVAVEGKAGESFDDRCRDWINAGDSPRSPANRQRRLAALCGLVGCDMKAAASLRYQLFVRVVAALREAKEANSDRAIVLVHSFDRDAAGADDFFKFAKSIGVTLNAFNELSAPVMRDGVRLQLGWVRDRARSARVQ